MGGLKPILLAQVDSIPITHELKPIPFSEMSFPVICVAVPFQN